MHGYAGVAVFDGGRVLMVEQPLYFDEARPGWSVPSGRIEDGERPEEAAVREVFEETGCVLDLADLTLVSTTTIRQEGAARSRSWTYTARVDSAVLDPDGPGGEVISAAWVEPATAVERLAQLPYPPLREPGRRFLSTGDTGLDWTFEITAWSEGSEPTFAWEPPAPRQP